MEFAQPKATSEGAWQLLVDTSEDRNLEQCKPGEKTKMPGRSLELFTNPIAR